MKKYWVIIKSTWQEYLAYRFNFFLEILAAMVGILVFIGVWHVIFKQKGEEQIGGYTLAQIITYLLGSGLMSSFLGYSGQGDEINDDINRGNLSNFIIKPFSVPLYWFTRDFCRKILSLLLGFIPLAMIFFLFQNYFISPSFLNLILFLVFVFLALLLHFSLFYIFSILAFWCDQTWGFRFVLRVISEVAAGSLIPISLFPELWRNVFNFLPFKYFAYVPLQIYLGKFSFLEIGREFIAAIIWFIIFLFFACFVWKKGVKHYSAAGG